MAHKTKSGESKMNEDYHTSLRTKMLNAVRKHAEAHIEKHMMNVEVYLQHPVGVGEHSDIMDAIEKELDQMAQYEDHLEILKKYF
jgi:hypothetical protein